MALGTGLGGSVGIAKETTYGTWVAPTRWVEVHSAKLQEKPNVTQGTGLAGGRLVDLGTRRAFTYADANGTMELEFLNQGMALLLANAMGSPATLTQLGSTSAYQIACSLGAPDNQNYMSLQTLLPDTGGNIKQQNFHGCKLQSTEWTIDMSNPLMWTFNVDSQQFENTSAAGSPTFTSNSRIFTFTGMNFKVGAYGSESFIDGVTKMTCKIERGFYTKRIYMGQSAKSEPLSNAVVKISGTADVDLTPTNKSVLWDIYHTQTAVPSIVMGFTGAAIGTSGYNDSLVLNPTDVFIDTGGTPELDGPDVVKATLNWSGLIDTANDSAFKATLTTSDATF